MCMRQLKQQHMSEDTVKCTAPAEFYTARQLQPIKNPISSSIRLYFLDERVRFLCVAVTSLDVYKGVSVRSYPCGVLPLWPDGGRKSQQERLHLPSANRVNTAEHHTLFVAPGQQWSLSALNLLTIFLHTELVAHWLCTLINAV